MFVSCYAVRAESVGLTQFRFSHMTERLMSAARLVHNALALTSAQVTKYISTDCRRLLDE